MIVACDVDGVVADLHAEWLRRYNADYGDTMTREAIRSWGVHEFVRPECGKRIYEYLGVPDLYDRVPVIAGAAGGIAALRRMGHRIVFVTSNVKGMADQKWEWLERHGFLPVGTDGSPDLVSANDKSLIATEAMIEDYAGNLRIARAGRKVLLTQPWNAGDTGPWTRVGSWPEIVTFFRECADA